MAKADLTDFIEQVTGDSHLRVEDDLGDGYVVLRVSEAERRQARHDVRSTEDIVIEMLRNARDAHARNIFLAVSKEENTRRLCMLDDGSGIPAHLVKRIFDARVTSKLDSTHVDTWGVHGRGMALYAVRSNSKSAYVAATKVGGGSAFVIETDTTVLPEKKDQSSMPVFSTTEAGTIVVTGARNINRTVAEFAYVDRENCSVYLGSPTEIAATLYEFGMALLPKSTRVFCDDAASIDVCKRLGLASSPEELVDLATSVGLEMSQRSARRILAGEIAPLEPFVAHIAIGQKKMAAGKRKRNAAKDQRGLKLAASDVQALKNSVQSSFAAIAPAYYLEPDVEVALRVRKDAITLSIPVEKLH